jgi:hypothetical protein
MTLTTESALLYVLVHREGTKGTKDTKKKARTSTRHALSARSLRIAERMGPLAPTFLLHVLRALRAFVVNGDAERDVVTISEAPATCGTRATKKTRPAENRRGVRDPMYWPVACERGSADMRGTCLPLAAVATCLALLAADFPAAPRLSHVPVSFQTL